MTRIIGLDLSLVSTGLALPDGTTTTIRPDRTGITQRRLNELFGKLWRALDPENPQVAIVEGPSLHSPGELGKWRRAKWAGCAELALERLRCHVVEVPPATLKKYATDNGAADKPAMVQAALDAGGDPANDDEADAYLLWCLGELVVNGRDLFNQPDDVTRRERLALDLWWPTPEELARAS